MREATLPFGHPLDPDPDIVPARKLSARVAGLYAAVGDDFETREVESLDFGFDGIQGDYHQGPTRRSGGREPWYARGTEIRNERQVSIVAPDELARIARNMDLASIRPEWVGANLLIDGLPMLSFLPAGTMLFFKGGATLKVDGQNAPCRIAGRRVAERGGVEDREAGALLFPKAAKRLRGLVAWVEKPGRIVRDEEISVRVPEQWIYRA